MAINCNTNVTIRIKTNYQHRDKISIKFIKKEIKKNTLHALNFGHKTSLVKINNKKNK